MIVSYKRNKQPAYFYSYNTKGRDRLAPVERPHGSFESCGDCPYVSQGFICYGKEGDCLKLIWKKSIGGKNNAFNNDTCS